MAAGDVVLFSLDELQATYFVLGPSGRDTAVALLDWSGTEPPPLDQLTARPLALVICCEAAGLRPLEGERPLGNVPPSKEQLAALLRPLPIRTLEQLREEAAKRFAPAVAAKLSSTRRAAIADAEVRDAAQLRDRWPLARLDSKSLFEDWEYPDAVARAALRDAVRAAASRARLVGSAGPRAKRRAVIQELVERLNTVDEEHDCIETVVREDLSEIVDAVSAHLGLEAGLADEWRDW